MLVRLDANSMASAVDVRSGHAMRRDCISVRRMISWRRRNNAVVMFTRENPCRSEETLALERSLVIRSAKRDGDAACAKRGLAFWNIAVVTSTLSVSLEAIFE